VIAMASAASASVMERANMTNLLLAFAACRLAGGRVVEKKGRRDSHALSVGSSA
jgi:hypothetical protein